MREKPTYDELYEIVEALSTAGMQGSLEDDCQELDRLVEIASRLLQNYNLQVPL